jgi:hypothetical protein
VTFRGKETETEKSQIETENKTREPFTTERAEKIPEK